MTEHIKLFCKRVDLRCSLLHVKCIHLRFISHYWWIHWLVIRHFDFHCVAKDVKISSIVILVSNEPIFFQAVEAEHGYNSVVDGKKWPTVARKTGHLPHMGSLLRNHYRRLIHPYILYKSGVALEHVQVSTQFFLKLTQTIYFTIVVTVLCGSCNILSMSEIVTKFWIRLRVIWKCVRSHNLHEGCYLLLLSLLVTKAISCIVTKAHVVVMVKLQMHT